MALSNIGPQPVATSLKPVFLFLNIQATETATDPHRGQPQLQSQLQLIIGPVQLPVFLRSSSQTLKH
jgi:hypothetical protein